MTSFIVPGEPRPKRDPYAKHDRQFEEAQAARKARRARDKALAWDKAVKQVRAWTSSSAVEALQAMPTALQQMYLLAEELNQNRAEVLRFFPAVAPSTREVWSEVVSPPATTAAKPRQTRKKAS
jgi:hypothetical protein